MSLIRRLRAAGAHVVWIQHSGDRLPRGSNGWQYLPDLSRDDAAPVVLTSYPWAMPDDEGRPARVEDVHELALAMPHVTVERAGGGNPVYQVGRKSFIFFRNPRPDAFDPDTRERYDDVIVFWVPEEADKLALVQDEHSPYFTTPHFDGHLSVLLRGSRIGELSRRELAEVVQDAWLSRASARRAADWLAAH